MFFEPLLTGDVWWLVVNKRRRRRNALSLTLYCTGTALLLYLSEELLERVAILPGVLARHQTQRKLLLIKICTVLVLT